MKNTCTFLVTFLLVLVGLASCRSLDEGDKAQETLESYLTYLYQGQYAAAAELYGGSYNILMDWNPDVESSDHATLFERGCRINGLQCLAVNLIGERREIEPGVYHFYVYFENPDSSRFERTIQDEQADNKTTVAGFSFTVAKDKANFFVQELPVYLP